MIKQLFLNLIISVLFLFSCTGDILREKQALKPFIQLNFGETRTINRFGLTVKFKKMDTDSVALTFLIFTDSTKIDSLPLNINEIILGISLKSLEIDSKFRLIFMDNYTQLSLISTKSQIDSIYDQAVKIIYNQSFDSTLSNIYGIDSEDLQRYHSDKFVTTMMACIITGNVDFMKIESLIERHFSDRTVGTGSIKDFKFPMDNSYIKNKDFNSPIIDSMK